MGYIRVWNGATITIICRIIDSKKYHVMKLQLKLGRLYSIIGFVSLGYTKRYKLHIDITVDR